MSDHPLERFFSRDLQSRITIVGTNSLTPILEQSAEFLAAILKLNDSLEITVLCESDSENFNQSLCTDTEHSQNRTSYTALSRHRDLIIGAGPADGLVAGIRRSLQADESTVEQCIGRIRVMQVNLRLPLNIVIADGRVWTCAVTNQLPTIDDYQEVVDSAAQAPLRDLVDFYTNSEKAAEFLSKPGEELIQLYDDGDIPRGIFPRAAFYTTRFQRYSIWGFVFNREGQLLLHQRSATTADGRHLWDKSVGGHVDLVDSSTHMTAQRELIEELFLPQDMKTPHMRADLGDIINFGDWNPIKRPEYTFREAFSGLGENDWVMFRATAPSRDNPRKSRDPLTVHRLSNRRFHDGDGSVSIRKTRFISDVYFFVSPSGVLDNDEQMKKLLGSAEHTGAAEGHKLVTISELRDWIASFDSDEKADAIFTNDLLAINIEHRDKLESFAAFIQSLAD